MSRKRKGRRTVCEGGEEERSEQERENDEMLCVKVRRRMRLEE